MVDVTIGKEGSDSGTTFQVHRTLLCRYSFYFKSAFTNDFKEKDGAAIGLPNLGDGTFLCKHYLNLQVLRPLVDLYIFADEYDTPRLRRDIMTVFTAILKDAHIWIFKDPARFFETMAMMYETLPPTSAPCRCMAALLALASSWGYCDSDLTMMLPKNRICDLFHLRSGGAGRHPWLRMREDCCSFYDHESEHNEEGCYQRYIHDTAFLVSFLEAMIAHSKD
ncbi:hypothetical protein P154DRAFT_617071 [Amniculicola lignicola CBS 123094]|uniref:BTB domain-containing protein n=1 Tax=Amniculicola lignicola CBS 123094 TaxID=1392246 RepID=A0A6A5WTX3_9PLEO|nr:hypothetical protein P154DRAFT_617071 [Amniculicola lignicola CBS 123094]